MWVILSFVNPLQLLNQTNDSQTANGVPIGMNSAIVGYFTSHNIRVMLSIGGVTPSLIALQSFINAYRAILPYDATGANPAARLTIDLAAGDQYLVALAAKATAD